MPASRYAYLGPEGTFTEAALRTVPEAADAELLPYRSVSAALDAVRRGEVSAALVPLENSVGGGVASTIDELSTGGLLHISREVLLDVGFALAVRPGTSRSSLKRVAAHPQAEAQCRRWIADNLSDVEIVTSASNAEAAASVAAPASSLDGAITSALAAQRYGTRDRRRRHPRPRRGRDALRTGRTADGARRCRLAPTRRRWSRSLARTTPARCSRCSPSSRCAAST